MLTYAIHRLALIIPVIAGVLVITFLALALSLSPEATARLYAGGLDASPEQIARTVKTYHLDDPLPVRFWYWLSATIRGNLGESAVTGHPVISDVKTFLPHTIELMILAFIMTMIIGIPLGVYAAVGNYAVDAIVRLFSLLGVSAPVYLIGFLLQYFIAFKLGLLPMHGISNVTPVTHFILVDSYLSGGFGAVLHSLSYMILPAFSIAYISLGVIALTIRGSLLEILEEDFIRTARSMGAAETRINFKHALRNAWIPTLTVAGVLFTSLLDGAVITELVFGYPGIGWYTLQSIQRFDYAPVMALAIIFALSATLVNLLVDLIYFYVDPRLRYS